MFRVFILMRSPPQARMRPNFKIHSLNDELVPKLIDYAQKRMVLEQPLMSEYQWGIRTPRLRSGPQFF
jgi:hypothetical protein